MRTITEQIRERAKKEAAEAIDQIMLASATLEKLRPLLARPKKIHQLTILGGKDESD